MEPTPFLAFLYGFVGSLALELILVLRAMGPRGGLPKKYRSRLFWIVRLSLAVVSGSVATAYFSKEMPFFLYVHLGAATPAIITRSARAHEDVADADNDFEDDRA